MKPPLLRTQTATEPSAVARNTPLTNGQMMAIQNRLHPDFALSRSRNHTRRCNPRIPRVAAALPEEAASPAEPSSRNGEGGNGAANGQRAIHLYLREIGQVELLTPQQELELVLEVKQGNEKARHRLLTASLRRVVQISREYENIGLPLLDLISEGNLGLLKAIERFDPAKGDEFASFSTWWIKQSIKRALAAQSKAIPSEKPLRAARQPQGPAMRRNLQEEAHPFVGRRLSAKLCR